MYTCARNQILSSSHSNEQYVIRMTQAIEAMPEGVSKMSHVLDLHGFTFSMNCSLCGPLRLMQVWDGYFADTMNEVLVVDLPPWAKFLLDATFAVIPEKTRSKVKLLCGDDAKKRLRETCDVETADRIIATMDQNRNATNTLEERQKTWVQVNKDGELVPVPVPTL